MNEIVNVSGIDCYEKDGTAYLRLEAVARALGFTTTQIVNDTEYTNVRWKRVDEYLTELNFATSGKNGERPEFIPENVCYRLAMKAKNELAERFQKKLADEILPAIRKTGVYAAPTVNSEMMFKLAEAMAEKERQIHFLETEAAKNRPLVEFAEHVSTAANAISIGDFAKLLNDEQIPIGRNRLFDWLKGNGYLQSDNVPYQRYIDAGYFKVIEQTYNTPYQKMVTTKTLVTGKGQIYFTEKLRENDDERTDTDCV